MPRHSSRSRARVADPWSPVPTWLFLLTATVLAVRVVLAASVPLITDEAYYWVWSRHLALSYLDHPPGIAYLIAATTVASDAPLAVRAGPLALNLVATALVYLVGCDLFDRRTGVLAAALFQITPVFVVGGVLAAPDAPLGVAWLAVMLCALRAVKRSPRWWLPAGVALGLGLLSKLTIVALPLGLAAFFITGGRRAVGGLRDSGLGTRDSGHQSSQVSATRFRATTTQCPSTQRDLSAEPPSQPPPRSRIPGRVPFRVPSPESRVPAPRSPVAPHRTWLLRGALAALVLFLPVIVWNATHDWAGARFVLAGRAPIARTGLAGLGDVALSLVLFTGPLLFPLLAWALWRCWRARRDPALAFLWWTSAPIVVLTLAAAALRGSAQWHWAAPGVAGATIALARLWPRRLGPAAAALSAPTLALIVVFAVAPSWIPAVRPFDEFLGWDRAAAAASAAAGRTGAAFLCGDRFRSAAQLAYHTRERWPVTILPEPPRGSVWPDPAPFAGRSAVCVTDAAWRPRAGVRALFDRVDEQPPVVVVEHGAPLRTFRVVAGSGFRGPAR